MIVWTMRAVRTVRDFATGVAIDLVNWDGWKAMPGQRWGWGLIAAPRVEMDALGLSWWFSVDRQWFVKWDAGNVVRIVVAGWGLEVYRLAPMNFVAKI